MEGTQKSASAHGAEQRRQTFPAPSSLPCRGFSHTMGNSVKSTLGSDSHSTPFAASQPQPWRNSPLVGSGPLQVVSTSESRFACLKDIPQTFKLDTGPGGCEGARTPCPVAKERECCEENPQLESGTAKAIASGLAQNRNAKKPCSSFLPVPP